jgi:hypothetical protein
VTATGAGTTIAGCNLTNNIVDGASFDLSWVPQTGRYSAGIFDCKLSWNGRNGATIIGANDRGAAPAIVDTAAFATCP